MAESVVPSGVSFRAATAADAGAVAGLPADSWRRFYRGAYAEAFLDGDVVADRRAVWSERLARQGPEAVTILAEAGGETGIAGFVHLVLDDHERWGSLIDNLHVSHRHHRHGIGSALLTRAAEAAVDRATTPAVDLWVLEQNLAAQAFYAAHGAGAPNGTWCRRPGAFQAASTAGRRGCSTSGRTQRSCLGR
jgi:ribosomal protein S18 acetylase RimI-like enzyme